MNEQKLVRILHSGDRETFYHIMEAYNKLLWLIVGGVLSDTGTIEDIEECISDVYVKLWQNPKAYNPDKGSLKTFIAIMAKRKALDRYRQLTRVKTVELDEFIQSPDDELLEYIVQNDMYNELYEAIRTLKEPDKEILIRRYFFDEKPSGIADKISLPVKEIKNRLYQSKQLLKRTLQAKEVASNG
jgi:RNA polymerase sigma-70 factor (ECF subfamily)